ncbi:RNase A-like domain-containing protein [Streptomyces sp. NPDC051219]|uniref:RNase A-like domain-containing protein n=1 Tax=Streptomyces sp. NPDC051219 TaxID=3155283 RepID=UPI003418B752
MAGPTPGPTPAQPPAGNGNIDVKPSDLWRVSGRVAHQQTALMNGARDLLTGLQRYPDAGGAGTDAREFSVEYQKIANRWLEVWAKSVASIGGVAVGFTETANAYAKADAAANPKPGKTAEQKPPPGNVIDKPPSLGTVPDLKWGDNDGGDDILRSLMENISPPVRAALQPVFKNVFRLGKVADVFPYPQQHYLYSLSQSWSETLNTLSTVSSELSMAVGTITNPQQADWEDAMHVFCSAIWGATDWGHQRFGQQWAQQVNSGPGTPKRPTGSQPVFSVLFTTAEEISKILRDYAEAAVKLNQEVWDELVEAMKQALKDMVDKDLNLKDGVGMKDVGGLVKTIGKGVGKGIGALAEFDVKTIVKLDTAELNRIVDTYTTTLDGLTTRMKTLMDALNEAHLSAPKYETGVARAHGFGARALDEFKTPQRWIKEDVNGNYTLDLASNEWLNNGHTLDKHVGKTDEQLAQRLRDQQNGGVTQAWPHGKPVPSASSSFKTYADAERLTQHNLNKNRAEIEAWLAGNPASGPGPIIRAEAPNQGEVTGRSVLRNDPTIGWRNQGMNATAVDVHYIETRLKYSPHTDPPFTVVTSMPSNKPPGTN